MLIGGRDELRIALAAERPLKNQIYNIGSGRVTGPEELAGAVRSLSPNAKVDVLPEARSFRWGHTNHLDISRAREPDNEIPETDRDTDQQFDVQGQPP